MDPSPEPERGVPDAPPRAVAATGAGGTVGLGNRWAAEQLQLALEAGGFGTWHWDLATGVTHWDRRLEELFGLEEGGFDGTFDAWLALLHPDDRDRSVAAVEEALATRGPYVVQHRAVWADGTVRWLEGRGAVTLDDDGEVTGTIGCCADVTDRVLAGEDLQKAVDALERAAATERIGGERLEFLVAINEALAEAPDTVQLMANVAYSAVPRLGDWCSVSVLPEDGEGVPAVEVAHVDPDMVAYARELQEQFPYDPDAPVGLPAVIRTGRTEFYPAIDDEMIAAAQASDETKEALRALRIRSSILVPIRGRSRILGAMQFVTSGERRPYTGDDVALAEVVAERVGAALDNLRLTEQLHRDQFRGALDALLDHVTIGSAVRDEDGRIVDFTIEFMNERSVDGAGRGPAELVGQRVLTAYPQWDESGLFDAFRAVVDDQEPLVMERRHYDGVAPDGTPISGWWTLQVVPFENGYLAATRDETAAVLAERDLQAAREEQQRNQLAVELLQAACLPTELPRVRGLDIAVRYEPVAPDMPVGGDWYDVFEVPGRQAVGVVIADVAGHGTEAARTMVQVRNTLRAFALEGLEPHDVLVRTNAVFMAGRDNPPFATCCYLVVDTVGSTATWSCAGHFPPVLRHAGRAESLEQTSGVPLGVDADAEYTSASVGLSPGDDIVLFTDGLIERRSESIDDGIDRLLATLAGLPPAPIGALVSRLLDELLVGQERVDDLALVGLGFGPAGSPDHPWPDEGEPR